MKLSRRQWIATPILTIILIGLLLIVLSDARDRMRIAAHRSKMQAAGQPATFAELQPAAVAPEQDAATYLKQAGDAAESIEAEVTQFIESLPEEKRANECGEVLPPAAIDAARAALAKHPEAIAQIFAASDCPYLHGPIDSSGASDELTAYLQRLRSATRTLNYQAAVQLADGDRDGAMETSLAMLRLGRLADQNPTFLGYLVACAVKGVGVSSANNVLRSGSFAEDTHERLDKELARSDTLEAFRRSMRAEQLRMLDRYAETLNIDPSVAWLISLFVDEGEYLDYLDLAIKRADQPCQVSIGEIDAAEQKLGFSIREIAPAVGPALGSLARTQAELRCLRVLNQLLLQDPDAAKRLAIDQLGLPADAIVDPFDGKPLRMKHAADGWTVYSVGRNYQDDGGKLDDQSDVGVGPVGGPSLTDPQ